MNALDVVILQETLAADAAHMTQLILHGNTAQADAHLEACNYKNRLETWKAATR